MTIEESWIYWVVWACVIYVLHKLRLSLRSVSEAIENHGKINVVQHEINKTCQKRLDMLQEQMKELKKNNV